LVDQTNREGLRETPEQQVLLQVVRYAVQDRLGSFLNSMERQYKHKKIDLGDAQAQVERLEDRAKTAIGKLKKLTPPEGDPRSRTCSRPYSNSPSLQRAPGNVSPKSSRKAAN